VLNRRPASLLAALTVAGLAVAGCDSPGTAIREQSAAVRVDDATVSQSDFEDQLDLLYENDDLRNFVFPGVAKDQLRSEGDARDSFKQEYVGAVAGIQVQFLVVAQVLEDEGIELTDNDRAAVSDQLDEGLPDGVDSLPDEQRENLVNGFAGFAKLRSELGEDELTAVVGKAFDDATIVVNTRYGRWDPNQFTVTPPPGPAPAPGTSDPTTGQTSG
jgi:hypothetical protein